MIAELAAGKIKDNNCVTNLSSSLKNLLSTSQIVIGSETWSDIVLCCVISFFQFQLVHKQNIIKNLIKS